MTTRVRVIQILLTIVCGEFFGPIIRDYSPSHALNPDWVGHARVHLVWTLGYFFFSGLANLYLIWLRRPFELRNLWLSAGWLACNFGGFWISVLLVDAYDGAITMPDTHMHIFGYDENVVVFTVLSIVLGAAVWLLYKESGGEDS